MGDRGRQLNRAEVRTHNVKDDAITLAKMAAGTDGNIITYDANGDPAAVATGSANAVLTSNGAGAAPTFDDPASQSDLETNPPTATSVVVAANQHFHVGHPKCWAYWTVSGGTATLVADYNVTSIADGASAGQVTVNWDTDFSDTNYVVVGMCGNTGNGQLIEEDDTSRAVGSAAFEVWNTGGSRADPAHAVVVAWGDH